MPRLNVRYCKGCSDRQADCHIKCFAYNVELARLKIIKDKLLDDKKKNMDYIGFKRERVDVTTRRYNR